MMQHPHLCFLLLSYPHLLLSPYEFCVSLRLSFPAIFIPCTCSFDFRWVLTVLYFAHPSALAFHSTNFVSLRLLIPPPLPLCFFSSFNPSLPSLSVFQFLQASFLHLPSNHPLTLKPYKKPTECNFFFGSLFNSPTHAPPP